jgi:outer membrane receptor protein involved in Fe transport
MGLSAGLALAWAFAVETAVAQPPQPTAAAPGATAPGQELQEVTVSASAISIAGYQAPTPVTAVGIQQLQSEARTDIADAVRALPAFSASPSPENSLYTGLVSAGIQGEDLLNLRNLGITRTLVLFDGQRVVSSNIQGGVDTSTIPSVMIERIDTVTGGASATWGSDALAGVVNLILNKRFNGAQINLEYSNNDQWNRLQQKVELALGTGFADDKGHVEVAGSFWNVPNPYFTADVPGWQSQRLVSGPAAGPTWVHGNYVGLATASTGGLITGPCFAAPVGALPPAMVPCGALTNIGFGPGGSTYQFNPGNVSAGFFSNGGTPNYDKGFIGVNAQPLRNETAFGLVSWKFNDKLSASLQLNYGSTYTENNSYTADQYGNVPIYAGNPFIPTSIADYMTANGINSFTMGTTNQNNHVGGGGSFGKQEETVSIPVAAVHRVLERGVFTLDGAISDTWTWAFYYMHGQSHMYEYMKNNAFFPNLLAAENVVVGPAGVPVCAAPLPQYATAGCQPLNIMGEGVASQGAINYISGPAKNGLDAQSMTLFENVYSLKAQGTLPFGLPAGAIAAAAGVMYRDENAITVNCGFNCDNVLFNLGNFAAFGPAGYNIKEGNAEINVPLLKDSFVRDASIDLAARVSDYSTSGTVETYKFGLVSQMTDWVRLRASYSKDIRAPNLFELFSNPLPILSNAPDPRIPNTTAAYFATSLGNPALLPETGETKTIGLVFTPVPGFQASIDYYYILIKDVINDNIGSGAVIAQCEAGNASFCEQLEFNAFPGGCRGPTLNSCPPGPLKAVLIPPVNFDKQSTSGLDFNGDYRFNAFGGGVDLFTAENYTFEDRYVSPLHGQCDIANSLNWDAGFIQCPVGLGVPKFRGTFGATFTQGPWLGTIQERMIGAAALNTAWHDGVEIDHNAIPMYWYTDLRLSYKWDNGLTLYAAVDNLMDKIMPVVPSSPYVMTIFDSPYRDDVYDGFGRVFRVGIRGKF